MISGGHEAIGPAWAAQVESACATQRAATDGVAPPRAGDPWPQPRPARRLRDHRRNGAPRGQADRAADRLPNAGVLPRQRLRAQDRKPQRLRAMRAFRPRAPRRAAACARNAAAATRSRTRRSRACSRRPPPAPASRRTGRWSKCRDCAGSAARPREGGRREVEAGPYDGLFSRLGSSRMIALMPGSSTRSAASSMSNHSI